MKKLISVLAVLCLPVLVSANDLRVVIPDSIVAADTNAARVDTVYSPWASIAGAQKLQFYSFLRPPTPPRVDTNFTNDSFFVDVEISFDKQVVSKLFLIDTFVTTDSGWAGVADDKADLLNADSLRGNWMRVRAVHRAPDIGGPGFLNKSYGKILTLYYTLVK